MWPKCTKVMPAIVHPTKCNVTQQCCEYIVPEIHPSHTTNITHHHYKHVHSFPHTFSQQQTVSHQNVIQPPTFAPAPGPRPGFAGPAAAPGFAGPGVAPGWGARPRRFF
ncbi:spore coat protein [Bacillus alkalicellulosilyticus]|uniref:spore coat protein n=1 Tax=Alkalihalobacterium alkalicellulosilyticum TaxID=1912214 RepID=UPI0009980317|nr:spore coat protein [Bacillus alkalicellulosilyticus]